MKKKIIIFLMLCSYFTLFASLSKTFNFNQTNLTTKITNNNGSNYINLSYEGLGNTGEIGQCLLPVKYVTYSIPYNASNLSLTIDQNITKRISLSYPIEINNGEVSGDKSISPGLQDQLKTTPCVEIVSDGFVGSQRVVSLAIRPITNSLICSLADFHSDISFTINWDNDNVFVGAQPIAIAPAKLEIEKNLASAIVANSFEVNINGEPVIMPLTLDMEEKDYIIITPEKYYDKMLPFAAMRRDKGYASWIVTLESIINNSALADEQTISNDIDGAQNIRAFIKKMYTQYGTCNYLLAGDEIPHRMAYCYMGKEDKSEDHIPTDLYYSELNSIWENLNNDCNSYKKVGNDIYCEVRVGRIPFKTEDEIDDFYRKLKNYEFNPGLGNDEYLNRALLSKQNEYAINLYNEYYTSSFFNLFSEENLVDLSENIGYTPTGADVIKKINEIPCGIHNFMGHGNPGGVAVSSNWNGIVAYDDDESHHNPEQYNGLDCLNASNYPGWAYNMSCTTMPFDYEMNNDRHSFGGQYLLCKGGGISYIGNTRSSYCSEGTKYFKAFFEDLDKNHSTKNNILSITPSYLLNCIKSKYPGSSYRRESFTHNVLGDPLTPLYIAKTNKINAQHIDEYVEDSAHPYVNVYKVSAPREVALTVMTAPLIDEHYAYQHRITRSEFNKVEVWANCVNVIYGQNSKPEILPLIIKDFCFWQYASKYVLGSKIEIGSSSNPNHGVQTANEADIIIEGMDSVFVHGNVDVKHNSKLHIKSDKFLYISDITVENGATLILEAPDIDMDKASCSWAIGSTVIINGQSQNHTCAPAKRANAQHSFIEEGKTWWYTADWMAYPTAEVGVTIGGLSDLYDGTWHEVRAIKGFYSADRNTGEYAEEELNELVALVKEENGCLLARDVNYNRRDGAMAMISTSWWPQHDGNYDVEKIHTVYPIGNVGEKHMIGEGENSFEATIESIKDIVNSGINYQKYECSVPDCEFTQFAFPSENYNYIPGIGVTEDHPLCQVFFAPFHPIISRAQWIAKLRYVTDKDNNIIYTGKGGLKAWEMAGVNDVVDDTNEYNAPVYYNLQGVRIDKPAPGQVVIKRQGSKTTKIII